MLTRLRPIPCVAVRALGATSSCSTRLVSSHAAAASQGFRAGATNATPFAKSGGGGSGEGTLLGWTPSPKLMRNPVFRFLFHNALPIATYQLILEVGFTAVFGFMIYSGKTTGEGIVKKLEAWHYPFMSWISLEDCTYTEGIPVGPRTLKPEKLTAAHTGHNIASGLLPLQVAILMCTYPLAMRGYQVAMRFTKSGKAAAAAAAAAERATQQEAQKAAAAASKKAAMEAKKSAAGQTKRRPSYIPSSGKPQK